MRTLIGLVGVVLLAVQPTVEQLARDPVLFITLARKQLHWDEPAEPFKIAGPLYSVGTVGLGSFLITTSEGHILIDTGMPGSGPMIEAAIRKLGFKPEDIKLIFTGHAHSDHAGGHAYLKKLSGARVAVIREDKDLFESGGKLDFHYGAYTEYAFEPTTVDLVFADGDVIKWGGVAITAVLTNGHTKGSTSFVTTLVDNGKSYNVVFPNGTTVNPGYRLVNNPSYPGIADDYRRTFQRLEQLHPDIWIGLHAEWWDPQGKRKRSATEGAKAFVDPEGYRRWLAGERVKFDAAIRKEPAQVSVGNFIRAETDRYFAQTVKDGAFGKLGHARTMTAIEAQDVVRMNRDTLYSSGVFDLDAAPLTVTLPDPGTRFMSMQVISQDHFTTDVVYAPGRFTYDKARVGTRYVYVIIRTLANPDDAPDVKNANALQDRITIEHDRVGEFDAPNWDPASLKKVRDTISALALLGVPDPKFGRKGEVDPIGHLIGTAIGWGGNPDTAAMYSSCYPKANDGKTIHTLTVKDVPVDGFWSISLYNAKGFFEKNALKRYSLNNLTAKPSADGSFTVQFGGCRPETVNCLPIMPGWNYTVRMYRPRKAILDGSWKFPEATVSR